MSVKTFTFRYDSDGDIGKWMAAQANKSVSLELAIQTLIGNFDYQDLREAIPRQVILNAAKPKKKTRKPKAKKNKQAPENVDKPKQEEPSSKPDKKAEDNDDDANLGMFSSL